MSQRYKGYISKMNTHTHVITKLRLSGLLETEREVEVIRAIAAWVERK